MNLLNKLFKKNEKTNQEVEEPTQFREKLETEFVLLGGSALHSNQVYAVPKKYNTSKYRSDNGEAEKYNDTIEEKLDFLQRNNYVDMGILNLKEDGLPLRTMYNIFGGYSGGNCIIDILLEPKTRQKIENNENPSGLIYAIYYDSFKPVSNSWDEDSMKFFFTIPEQKKELLEYKSVFKSEELVNIKEVGTFKNLKQNLTKEPADLNYLKLIDGDYYSEKSSKRTQPQIVFESPFWIDSEIKYVKRITFEEENSQEIIKTMSQEYKQKIFDSYLKTLIEHHHFKSDANCLEYYLIKNILNSSF